MSTLLGMGLLWNRRKRAGRGRAVSLSRRGASLSQRLGPVTVSTRGRGNLRLGKGLGFRFKL